MSDAQSVATKSTHYTNATGFSSSSRVSLAHSARTNRRHNITKADWRLVVRDCYANVFDMVGDWAYLYAIYHRDYNGDGEADTYLLHIPFDYDTMVLVVLGFCIMSTIFSLWTMITSFGRNCGQNSMCCNCTVPRLSMAGILFEDVPQFALTM